MKLLIIGAGNMGLAYAQGIAKSGLVKENEILLMENSKEKIEELKQNSSFIVSTDLSKCLSEATLILLAVKPYQCEGLFKEIKPYVNVSQIFVSIMAGISLHQIRESIGTKKAVRAMPNLPALVGKGVTSFFASDGLTKEELASVQKILSTTGLAFQVNHEDLIDATTAISGSGPGYVFYFMEAMIRAAIELGFSYAEAKNITIKTLEGTTHLFASNDFTAQEWIDKVSSKGGTTEAAINFMEQNKVKTSLTNGMTTAYKRAKEIGSVK